MPSDEELLDLLGKAQHHYDGPAYSSESVKILRAQIDASVERALSPWMQAVGLATTFAGSVEVNPDDPLGMMEEIRQALAEREARHRRELIETAIRELSEYAVCHCCRFGVVCTTCHRRAILRAKLDALEVKP